MGLLSQDISKVAFKEPIRIGGGSVEYMYATHIDDDYIYLRTYNEFVIHKFEKVLVSNLPYNENIYDLSKSSPHILVEITSHEGSSDMSKLLQLYYEYNTTLLLEGSVWFYGSELSKFYKIPLLSKYQVILQCDNIDEIFLKGPLVCIENLGKLSKTHSGTVMFNNSRIECGILNLKLNKYTLAICNDSEIKSGIVVCYCGTYLKNAFSVFNKYLHKKKNIVEYKKNNNLFDLMGCIESNLFIYSDIKTECILIFEKLPNDNSDDFIHNFQIIDNLVIDYKPLNMCYRVNLVKDYLYSENYKLEKVIKQEVQKRAPSFVEYLKNISLKNL